MGKSLVISVVAPSGRVRNEERILSNTSIINGLGHKVFLDKELLSKHYYYAGTDRYRASSLASSLEDPRVDYIWCAAGGYGAIKTILNLPTLNKSFVSDKTIIGGGDNSILLNYLYKTYKIKCILAPNYEDDCFSDYNVLTKLIDRLDYNSGFVKELGSEHILNSGTASGILLGGQLDSIDTAIGTRFQCVFDNAIVCLDQPDLHIQDVDRLLSKLLMSGSLSKVSGIIFGEFLNIQGTEYVSMDYLLPKLLKGIENIPILKNIPFNRSKFPYLIPIGQRVTIDTFKGTLTVGNGKKINITSYSTIL